MEPLAEILTEAEQTVAADVRGTIDSLCEVSDMTRAERIVVYRKILDNLDAVNAIRKARGLDNFAAPT